MKRFREMAVAKRESHKMLCQKCDATAQKTHFTGMYGKMCTALEAELNTTPILEAELNTTPILYCGTE